MADAVTDPRDTRVLIPRIRRTLEGPAAMGSGIGGSTLTDDQINAIGADAIANIILYTGGLFGHTLDVTARDEFYLAPTAWLVDPALETAEESVIIAQAALDYFFQDMKAMKVSETIRDEAVEWSYSISANGLTEYLKNLRSLRDQAIQKILDGGAALESWTSFIAVRDSVTSAIIEPYVNGGAYGGQTLDPRFG